MMHGTDWYTVLARRAGIGMGVLANGSGPLPPDGIDVWDAMVGGGPSPRTEAVLNIDEASAVANRVGAIRVGDFKLITGAARPDTACRMRIDAHASTLTHTCTRRRLPRLLHLDGRAARQAAPVVLQRIRPRMGGAGADAAGLRPWHRLRLATAVRRQRRLLVRCEGGPE